MLRFAWLIMPLALAFFGCMAQVERKGIAGTWSYDFDGFLSDALPYTKTCTFSESGAVQFENRISGTPGYVYTGTWSLPKDSLVIEMQRCSYTDSTYQYRAHDCSGSPSAEMALYWDGNRVYGLNTGNGMRQYYTRN